MLYEYELCVPLTVCRNEKPFEVLVDAMTTGDVEVQAAVLELVNAIMMHENGKFCAIFLCVITYRYFTSHQLPLPTAGARL